LLKSQVWSDDERADMRLQGYAAADFLDWCARTGNTIKARKKTTHAHLYAPTAHPAQ